MQEQILDLYESNSKKLEDHIRYWNLERQEHVLQYYARREGLSRLGMQPLPALHISEARAKAAIEMELILESLNKTPYGREDWTLQEVSREKFLTDPPYTFKKGALNVEVSYGDHPTDYMPYVLWNDIYYQNEEGRWFKVAGQVDYEGLYFTQGGHKNYWVRFRDDAAQFGNFTERWVVRNRNTNITSSAPSASSQGSQGAVGGLSSKKTISSNSSRDSAEASAEATERGRKRRLPETPGPSARRGRRSSSAPRASSTPQPGRRVSTLASGQGEQRDPLRLRNQRRGGLRGRGGGLGRGSHQTRRSPRGHQPESSSSTENSPVPPEQVGRRHQTPERGAHTRLEKLIADARDPPVIVLRGPPNVVKCYRYRVNNTHGDLFDAISSTFTWVNKRHRSSEGRILIAFKSEGQRSVFVNTVKIPNKITWSYGQLDAL